VLGPRHVVGVLYHFQRQRSAGQFSGSNNLRLRRPLFEMRGIIPNTMLTGRKTPNFTRTVQGVTSIGSIEQAQFA
jgi:hypothetical protein